MKFESRLCLAIDYAHARDFSGGRIVDQAMYDTVRAKRQLSSCLGGWQGGVQTAEVRLRNAAMIARAAIMTRSGSAMWACEHSATSDGHQTFSGKVLSHSILHDQLAAAHFHRGQELPVRQLR